MEKEIKVAKWGTPKKYLKKEVLRLVGVEVIVAELAIVDLGCIAICHWLELQDNNALEIVEVLMKQNCAESEKWTE